MKGIKRVDLCVYIFVCVSTREELMDLHLFLIFYVLTNPFLVVFFS